MLSKPKRNIKKHKKKKTFSRNKANSAELLCKCCTFSSLMKSRRGNRNVLEKGKGIITCYFTRKYWSFIDLAANLSLITFLKENMLI